MDSHGIKPMELEGWTLWIHNARACKAMEGIRETDVLRMMTRDARPRALPVLSAGTQHLHDDRSTRATVSREFGFGPLFK